MKRKFSIILCGCLLAVTTVFSAIPSNAADVWNNDNSFVGTVAVTNYTGTDTNVTIPDKIDGKKVTVLKFGWHRSDPNFKIKKITIPNGIKFITGMTNINIDDKGISTEAVMPSMFTEITELAIPDSVEFIGDSCFSGCTSLESININNEKYCSEDGVLLNKAKTELIAYPGGKQGHYSIPESVTMFQFSCGEIRKHLQYSFQGFQLIKHGTANRTFRRYCHPLIRKLIRSDSKRQQLFNRNSERCFFGRTLYGTLRRKDEEIHL